MEIQTRQVRLRGGAPIASFAKSAEETPAANDQGGTPTAQATTEKEVSKAADLKQELEDNDSEYSTVIVTDDIVLTEDITVNHKVTLKGAGDSKPTISGGTITFGSSANESTVSNLTFQCGGTNYAVAQSVKIYGASNVKIENCDFKIEDACNYQTDTNGNSTSKTQFTSIWIQNAAENPSDNAIIKDCNFNFSNCAAGSTNVAIAIQSLNNSQYPANVQITNNHFKSTVKARLKTDNAEELYSGNSISVLTFGTEATLTIEGNQFEEVGGDGGSQHQTESYASMQAVELGGNVENAQIFDNDFTNSYIGVTVFMQGYQSVDSNASANNATILNNRFTNMVCGVCISPDDQGRAPTTSDKFTASNNIYTNCSHSVLNQVDNLTIANNDSVTTEEQLKIALQNAAKLAEQGKEAVVKLGENIDCSSTVTIPAGVTLDGGGHTIFSVEGGTYDNGNLIVASNGVVIQNLKVVAEKGTVKNDAKNSPIKHGVNFYKTNGCTIKNCEINANSSAIQANGCTDLKIDSCKLNLNAPETAWAGIEYGMGSDVTTIPTIEISGDMQWKEGMPLVYADKDTITKIIEQASIDVTGDSEKDKANAVLNYLQSKGNIKGVNLKVEEKRTSVNGADVYIYSIVSDSLQQPSTPSTPSTGGSSSTQKPLEGISLSMTSTQVGPGDTLQMNVTYTPSDTTASKRVTWTSSDEDVVTVDRNGKVTATGKSGKATITATVGGKTATCTITINPFKVDVEDLNGAVTSCKADGSTVIKVPQSMSYNFDISSGVTLDSFDYTVGNDKVGGTNTIARWNGTSGKYQIYAAGAVGSQTGVYVNGVKLFTIEVTERPFTSDTTLDMSLKVGTPYMFRITPDDKDASFTFLTADGKALSTSYKAELYPDEKGDYYCTVTPLQANRDIGVYCVIGGNTYKVFTVHTIA